MLSPRYDVSMSNSQNDSAPWFIEDAGPEAKKHAPATLRNRDAIVSVLRDQLPESGTVLELASGSGEHVIHFAEAFPRLYWQPSDMNAEACRSIAAWSAEQEFDNIAPPLLIDVTHSPWPIHSANAVVCINMVHISPWTATLSTFEQAAKILKPGDLLYFYGPYLRANVPTSQSNVNFDQSLRNRNAEWGLRDVADMDQTAADNGFARTNMVEMPANNLSLVFCRV